MFHFNKSSPKSLYVAFFFSMEWCVIHSPRTVPGGCVHIYTHNSRKLSRWGLSGKLSISFVCCLFSYLQTKKYLRWMSTMSEMKQLCQKDRAVEIPCLTCSTFPFSLRKSKISIYLSWGSSYEEFPDYEIYIFLISQRKGLLWVLIRSASLRHF